MSHILTTSPITANPDLEVGRCALLVLATIFLALFALATLLRTVFPDLLATLSPDSINFENNARALALEIARDGWVVWAPAPDGQTPIGLLAASMVVFGDTLAPIMIMNAALLAIAAAATVLLVSRLLAEPRWAVIGAGAFLFPSVVMVAAVPHKDPFTIFGAACVLLGLSSCARFGSKGGLARLGRGLALVGLGAIACWFVRPYSTVLILGAATLFATVLLLGLGAALVRRKKSASLEFARTFVALSLAVIALFLVSLAPAPGGTMPNASSLLVRELLESDPGIQCPIALPAALEARLGYLLATRQGFRDCCGNAATAIDIDHTLTTICDLVAYLPRAMAIAYLAPFPTEWFAPGRSPVTALSVVLEMSLIYLALTSFLVGAWYQKTREMIALLAFCAGLMVVLAIALPNVGTLYRMRIPYLLPLVASGFSVLASAILTRKR